MKIKLPSSLNFKGQSLVEGLVALSMASIVIVAIIATVTTSVSNSRISGVKNRANQLAQEGMEIARNQRNIPAGFYCFGEGDTVLTNPVGAGSCESPNIDNTYIRSVEVTEDGCSEGVSNVVTTVSWTESTCTNGSFCQSVQLASCLDPSGLVGGKFPDPPTSTLSPTITNTPTPTLTPTPTPLSARIDVIADATIRPSTSTNYGTQVYVEAYWSVYKGYFLFDLSSLAGDTVTSATLNLDTYSSSTSTNTFNIFETGVGWVETTINGDNAPAKIGGILSSFVPSSTGYISQNVTAAVAAKTGQQISFMIEVNGSATDSYQISSKEYSSGTYKAYLDIKYVDGISTPTPTPTNTPTATPVVPTATPVPPPPPSQPTMSGLPSCSNSTYTATINWTGTPYAQGFDVQVATSTGFSPFWKKNVPSGFSTAVPTGFTPQGTATALSLSPGTTYYTRVYNGTYSTVRSWNVPVCPTPTRTPTNTPTRTPTNTPTRTPTPTPAAVTVNRISNGGFESGSTSWVYDGSGLFCTEGAAGCSWTTSWGTRYLYLGGIVSYSDWVYQQFYIPSNATRADLTFKYRIVTTEEGPGAYDWTEISVYNTGGTQLGVLQSFSDNNATGWVSSATYNLLPYKGQNVRLRFGSFNDVSYWTAFLYDEVVVTTTHVP